MIATTADRRARLREWLALSEAASAARQALAQKIADAPDAASARDLLTLLEAAIVCEERAEEALPSLLPANGEAVPVAPFSAVAGPVAPFTCRTCGTLRLRMTDPCPKCVPLGGPSPGANVSSLRDELFSALHSVEGAKERWQELRLSGATDARLREAVGEAFGLGGSQGSPCAHKGGESPWFRHGNDKPITGADLLALVRSTLGIGTPPKEVARTDNLPPAPAPVEKKKRSHKKKADGVGDVPRKAPPSEEPTPDPARQFASPTGDDDAPASCLVCGACPRDTPLDAGRCVKCLGMQGPFEDAFASGNPGVLCRATWFRNLAGHVVARFTPGNLGSWHGFSEAEVNPTQAQVLEAMERVTGLEFDGMRTADVEATGEIVLSLEPPDTTAPPRGPNERGLFADHPTAHTEGF